MQISAINTGLTIVIAKSVGKLSPLPFFSLLINCIVWSIYGFLKWNMTVLVPNASGFLCGLWCTIVFHTHCEFTPKKLYICGILVVGLAIYFGLINDSASVGFLGCGLAVLVMGAPLATLRTVLAERSTASLPFWTSFTGWCNSLSWLSYGILIANDPYIYGPNIMGFVLASLQLALFILYGLPPQLKSGLPR